MKKLLIILFLAIGLSGMAQKPLKAFLSPVPNDLFKTAQIIDRDISVDQSSSVWLLRPSFTITAVQWNWDKTAKQFNAVAFQSAGIGIGWNHYTEVNGLPFNNYGANALLLFGTDISAGITFSGLGIFNFGVVYNFNLKQPGLLTGIQIKF